MQLRPSAALSFVLLPLAALFIWLGQWQLDRKQQKEQMMGLYESAPELEYAQADKLNQPYARIQLTGRYDPNWQLLLDNKVLNGRAGVHVLTLFHPAYGKPILVNRGWLPLGPDRSIFPEIPTPTGDIHISGMLINPAEDGVRIGEPEKLHGVSERRLVTYLAMSEVSNAFNGNVSQHLVQLDATDESGFAGRDWQPTVMLPAQHGAYAVQWFSLAVAILIIWFTLSWKRLPLLHYGEGPNASNGRQNRT